MEPEKDCDAVENGHDESEEDDSHVIDELRSSLNQVLKLTRAESKAVRVKRVNRQLELVGELESTIKKLKETKIETKPKRRNNNERPLTHIDPKLREFLALKEDETISRLDIIRAVSTYIHRKEDREDPAFERWEFLNPSDINRDLRNEEKKKIIDLDDTLKDVLQYDEFVRAVNAGEIKTRRKVEGSEKKALVTKTDSDCTFPVINLLVSKLVKS